MRCVCCDKPLSDREATAKFVPENKGDPPRYADMCKECQGFLPENVRVVTRPDLDDTLPDFDLPINDELISDEEDDYGYEN